MALPFRREQPILEATYNYNDKGYKPKLRADQLPQVLVITMGFTTKSRADWDGKICVNNTEGTVFMQQEVDIKFC